jgi:hypothetical protein
MCHTKPRLRDIVVSAIVMCSIASAGTPEQESSPMAKGLLHLRAAETRRSSEPDAQVDEAAFDLQLGQADKRPLSLRDDQTGVRDDPPPEVEGTRQKRNMGWEFELAPYMWMAGVDVTSAVGPIETSGEADFVDLLKNLDIGAMLHFEGRRDRWGFILDGLYIRLSDEAGARVGPVGVRGIDVEGTLEMTVIAGSVFYRFGEAGRSFDAIAGVSYFRIDIGIDAGPLPSIAGDKEWLDPFIGGRVGLDLSEKWFLSVRGDIGGFGVGSELIWDVTASLGYRLSKRATLAFGYRHLDVDYEDGRFEFDAQFSGPYVGLVLRF